MVTTNSPKVSRRHWYANLSSSHASLSSLHKTRNGPQPSFFILLSMICVFISSLAKEIWAVSSAIFTSSLSLPDIRTKKELLQKPLLSWPPQPPLTTKRRKRGACSGRFVWRRCQVWPHVPGRLSDCAPLPPGASAPAGWGSFRPSAPGSGSAPVPS